METFIAIDFETATAARSSICQIGITEVVDGNIQKPKGWLVKPDGNRYDEMNMWIHGITPDDTKNCPSFPEVWEEVQPYLQNKTVVAHNTSFDMYALRDALDLNKMTYPTFDYYCTLRIARCIIPGCYSYTLGVLLNHLGIDMDVYHRADSDSYGCAKLLLKCLEKDGHKLNELENIYNFHRGKFAPGVFIPHLKNRTAHGHGSNYNYKEIIDAITSENTAVDEGNYFYGKTVCFTGTCQFGVRAELLKKVAEVGGIPTNNVTAKTNVLVIGQQDYRVVGESGLSNKQKKAMELLNKGQDIEILSESEFLSMI